MLQYAVCECAYNLCSLMQKWKNGIRKKHKAFSEIILHTKDENVVRNNFLYVYHIITKHIINKHNRICDDHFFSIQSIIN